MQEHIIEEINQVSESALLDTLLEACKKIAPVWPLESFVAVNPYLGFSDQKFEYTAQQLANIGGIQMSMPLSFYREKIKEGRITRTDLKKAIAGKSNFRTDIDVFLYELENAEETNAQDAGLTTLIDVAAKISEKDWSRFATARISNWAASYFDKGQAIWNTSLHQGGIFEAWKTEAEIDRSTEIAGLKGFRKAVQSLPDQPLKAAMSALEILEIPTEALPIYLHRLLLRSGGWSAYIARLDWDEKVKGAEGASLLEFLAVLICWEACLFKSMDRPVMRAMWSITKEHLRDLSEDKNISHSLGRRIILQEALDLAVQRELISKFNNSQSSAPEKKERPGVQAIFCIDVRSEVFRRCLEQVDHDIETLGFAGFFAFPINFIPIAHKEGEAQCPVLIPSGPNILEEIPDKAAHRKAYETRVFRNQLKEVWKSFKSGAVSCFSFVSPIGLSYLPKLLTDSFGLTRPVPKPENTGLTASALRNKSVSLNEVSHLQLNVGIPLDQRIQMAKNALNAMSLTENFGRFVMIVGHGSSSVNNPHATGLDCGACGGRSGESNAKVAAAVLNDRDVREGLLAENIVIPEDTIFLACLHDTTTDEISIFNEDDVTADHSTEFKALRNSLKKAGKAARSERALRLATKGNIDKAIFERSKDWSQVRPEWGLAGCSAFVVANRSRTKNLNLEGKTFLHSYDWKKDEDFPVLELIMTAPMVVTSWINLQYYASVVDNKKLGAGNKTLHNVTGCIGVLEGFEGDLRVGLPLQSVHDGEKYQHEPARLNVIIEAPMEAMNAILKKHQSVRDLCENGWIYLFAMDENGKVSHRYTEDFQWHAVEV